jgi:hypothetical protein
VKKDGAKKNRGKTATAFHGKMKDGHDVVGLRDLRVVIVEESENVWFAQGLEIDYAVQGSSLNDVKKNFETGLCATIHENLRIYGNIERILKVAPQSVWKEMVFNPSRTLKRFSSVSFHNISENLKCDIDIPKVDLPFDSMQFIESRQAA